MIRPRPRFASRLCTAPLAITFSVAPVLACDCQKGAAAHLPLTPIPEATAYAAPLAGPSVAYPPQGAPLAQVDPGDVVAPGLVRPPGTLGYTYQRPSKPVPADKHPRVGMIDIYAPGAVAITVQSINAFREEDSIAGEQSKRDPSLWRFETEPLYPSIPNVYKIEVQYSHEGEPPRSEVKYARLIRGRIVNLRF